MAAISASEMLAKVKSAIGITGDFQDATLTEYINEVKEYLLSAGVPAAVLGTTKAAGITARGVLDLWNYGAGDGSLSPYFYQRAVQLIYTPVEEDPEPEPEVKKLTRVCGITPSASYDAGFPFFDAEESGIFQYGDRYFIKLAAYLKTTREIAANTQIQVAKIDEAAFYPLIDLYMTGYCTINDAVKDGMYRVWTHGSITVVTPDAIPAGGYFTVELSSEFMGVK